MSKKNKNLFSEKDVDKVFPKLCINQKIIDSFNRKEIEDTYSIEISNEWGTWKDMKEEKQKLAVFIYDRKNDFKCMSINREQIDEMIKYLKDVGKILDELDEMEEI